MNGCRLEQQRHPSYNARTLRVGAERVVLYVIEDGKSGEWLTEQETLQ
jgi:hypothetical protein